PNPSRDANPSTTHRASVGLEGERADPNEPRSCCNQPEEPTYRTSSKLNRETSHNEVWLLHISPETTGEMNASAIFVVCDCNSLAPGSRNSPGTRWCRLEESFPRSKVAPSSPLAPLNSGTSPGSPRTNLMSEGRSKQSARRAKQTRSSPCTQEH